MDDHQNVLPPPTPAQPPTPRPPRDIRAEDDAANEVVEAIMMATNAIGSSFADAYTGVATLLVDDTQWDAASLQAAVRALGTTVGPNNIDVTGSDVVAATTLTAA